ncbi:SDR family NAD(P)-dependent oxidoreductase, partial [Pseudoduganella sp. RAF53_2]
MKNFKDKVAVITGGASGFGREFAIKAHQLGMKIALADVQADALERTVQELREQGAQAFGLVCDVRKSADVQALADATMKEFGAVHL